MNQPQRHGDTELERINKITERIIGCAMPLIKLNSRLLKDGVQRIVR